MDFDFCKITGTIAGASLVACKTAIFGACFAKAVLSKHYIIGWASLVGAEIAWNQLGKYLIKKIQKRTTTYKID